MDIKVIIGQRINAALARHGMMQKDLAKAIGVHDNVISYYCSAARTPNWGQLALIAEILETSVDYLLGRTDNPSINTSERAISDYTGLSSKAVELLHFIASTKCNETSFDSTPELNRQTIDFINRVFEAFPELDVLAGADYAPVLPNPLSEMESYIRSKNITAQIGGKEGSMILFDLNNGQCAELCDADELYRSVKMNRIKAWLDVQRVTI